MTAPAKPELLQYQRDRALDDVPAYTAGAQLRLGDGTHAYAALSATELAVYFEDDLALHYDLEGRLTKLVKPNLYQRRGLSHRVLLTRKKSNEEGGGLSRTIAPNEVADLLVDEAHRRMTPVLTAWSHPTHGDGGGIEFAKPSRDEAVAQLGSLIERAARFDRVAAQADAARFRAIYGQVAVLPPDQYGSLVLQATEGCAYAGCLFCDLYRDRRFRCKTPDEFRAHVRAAIAYHAKGLCARRSIFLGEANALMQPQKALREIFAILHEHFELPASKASEVYPSWGLATRNAWLGSATRFDGVSSFLDAFSPQPFASKGLGELRALGLRRVYIGLESGDAALLRWLRKPATPELVTECVRALKEAGITVGLMVLLGAGGRRFARAHVKQTARLLNALPLDGSDYIYFSPLMTTADSHYSTVVMSEGIEPLTDDETRAQEKTLRAALRFGAATATQARGRPYLARYELKTFVY